MTVNNSLFVIAPYWDSGTWVFDDERVGLVREPFVSGVPDMIDHLVRDIPDAREGFRMIFSKTKYPGYSQSLSWRGTEVRDTVLTGAQLSNGDVVSMGQTRFTLMGAAA